MAVCHLTEFALLETNYPPKFMVINLEAGSPLIAPALGITVTAWRPVFNWAEATDDTGAVSYTLRITGSSAFTGLTTLETTDVITVSAPPYVSALNLPDARYTWSVRAWDPNGLPSEVITPQTFIIARPKVYLPAVLKEE